MTVGKSMGGSRTSCQEVNRVKSLTKGVNKYFGGRLCEKKICFMHIQKMSLISGDTADSPPYKIQAPVVYVEKTRMFTYIRIHVQSSWLLQVIYIQHFDTEIIASISGEKVTMGKDMKDFVLSRTFLGSYLESNFVTSLVQICVLY